MHPLPILPVDTAKPAPSNISAATSSTRGEESFSHHLAAETDRSALGEPEAPAPGPGNQGSGKEPTGDDFENSPEEQSAVQGPVHTEIPPGLEKKDDLHPGRSIFLGNVGSKENKSPLIILLDSISAKQGDLNGGQYASVDGKQTDPALARDGKIQAPLMGLSMAALSGEENKPGKNILAFAPPDPAASNEKASVTGLLEKQQTAELRTLSGDKHGAPIVVEEWQATFRHEGKTIHTDQTNTTNQPLQGETVIKTENGQLITVYQSSEMEEAASSNPGAARSALVETGPARRDADSNYIHSNLPNNASKTVTALNNDQHPDTNMEQQADPESLATAKEFALEPRPGGEKPTVAFMVEAQPSLSASQSSTTSAPGSGLLRMPSGILVPEQAVMEQVVTHFTGKAKLESGLVRLQLHPRELGELRLEIEVKQDNVKAHITTQNPQAREALDRHLPKLRETLAEQGLQLSEVEITVSAGDQYEGHRFRDNEARHQLGLSYRSGREKPAAAASTEDEVIAVSDDTRQSLSVTV